MAVAYRPICSAVLGVGLLLALTSCGGDAAEGSSATIAEVAATSYVVKPPVTTTTTTTTAAPSVAAGTGQTNALEQVYIIVSGDSVYRIADKHGITPEALVNYNGWTDGINHLLVVGGQVKIPPGSLMPGTATDTGSGSTGSTGAPSTQTTAPSGGGEIACEHTVVEGDNQGRVANQYDVTLEALAAANASNPVWNTFLLGSQIHIPAGGSC